MDDVAQLDPDLVLDDIDALVLTFAHSLAPHVDAGGEHLRGPLVESEYNPYSEDRMVA